MKRLPFALITSLSAAVVSAQDRPEFQSVSGDSALAPSILPSKAHLIGRIPDGTPPQGQPPTPRFRPSAVHVQSEKSLWQGGRAITVQKIAPIDLPSCIPGRSLSSEQLAAFEEALNDSEKATPGRDLSPFGASVYRFPDGSARTYATYWDHDAAKQYSFWSSADFALISGITTFVSSNGRSHSLMLVWSRYDMKDMAEFMASLGSDGGASGASSNIPEFDDAKPATFVFAGEAPTDPEVLSAIQSLHDIYNSRRADLLAGWQGCERARVAREAELKAKPPEPKDLTFKFWRKEKPVVKGGAQ